MFKNALLFRFGSTWAPNLALLEDKLQAQTFAPCGLTQERSVGWVPPRGQENGALAESVGGQWVLKLLTESKSVPASVIARAVDERCVQIEAETGRKPGKKEKKELKEDALLALIPHAFPARSAVQVWIDPESRIMMLDVASLGKADGVLTVLASAMEDLGLSPLQTTLSPAAAMSDWLLTQEPPAGFSIDRECELRANDDSKALVRYAKHALDIDEVQQHIQNGKVPTKLAMTYDGRISFVLTDKGQLSKLSFVEGVFDGEAGAKDEKSDRFDADVAISTGEIRKLIPALVEALGGEMVISGGTGPKADSQSATVAASAEEHNVVAMA